jgi:glutamyl-tRNA reductase
MVLLCKKCEAFGNSGEARKTASKYLGRVNWESNLNVTVTEQEMFARTSDPRKMASNCFDFAKIPLKCESREGSTQNEITRPNPGKAQKMKLFVIGLSYKTAPVELRESVAVHPSRLRCAGCLLKVRGQLSEVVVLSTCNRVELYGVADRLLCNPYALFHQITSKEADVNPYLYLHEDGDAIRHLFSVASGLDSMVLGETEITGQVKQAYQTAQEAKLTGKVLNRLFQTALQTAKEIRTTTGIGRGATSVGSVAVELAERIFDNDLSEKTVMIIGAGKMGEACIRHLARRGARSVLVSNRSYDRAVNLAGEFNGRAVRFDECLNGMAQADIVVSSTGSPETILSRADVAQVMSARNNRPLFLIDIAVPRDIDSDAQHLDNVYLYNVDHLETLVRENVQHREQELTRCHEIIAGRVDALLERLSTPRERKHESSNSTEAGWIPGNAVSCHG